MDVEIDASAVADKKQYVLFVCLPRRGLCRVPGLPKMSLAAARKEYADDLAQYPNQPRLIVMPARETDPAIVDDFPPPPPRNLFQSYFREQAEINKALGIGMFREMTPEERLQRDSFQRSRGEALAGS